MATEEAMVREILSSGGRAVGFTGVYQHDSGGGGGGGGGGYGGGGRNRLKALYHGFDDAVPAQVSQL